MPKKNVIIFDLDETIGHFYQVSHIYEGLKFYYPGKFQLNEFFGLLDTMPNVFHPRIFDVFKYLKKVKKKKNLKIIIYSNNTGTPKWANMIKKYIEHKIGGKLFDKVITAWKVDGKIYQKCRTTYRKTYKDILRCGKISKKAKIYFVDDSYHPDMLHNNVYYNQIERWMFGYKIYKVIKKYVLSKKCCNLTNEEKNKLIIDIPKYVSRIQWGRVNYKNSSSDLSSIHKKRGDALFQDIKNFVEVNSSYTRKIKKDRLNHTRKR
tara:strand:+ start:1258 stop:2046 length:789 start_codon:yes stop_codon:yes gene_type:complete